MMRGTPLGWTRCTACRRAVLVVTDAGVQKVGTHWMQPNRRCPASQSVLTPAHARAKTLQELPHV